jgi:hypothetical protein
MEDVDIGILWTFGLFYGHLVYFTVIWSILRSFGIFYGYFVYFSVLVCFTKKNLANLSGGRTYMRFVHMYIARAVINPFGYT